MSEYITKTYGPGDIAALPPTIGLTSRAPTIGSEDVGHPIKKAFPFHQRRVPGATQVEAAGMQYPMGMGQEENSVNAITGNLSKMIGEIDPNSLTAMVQSPAAEAQQLALQEAMLAQQPSASEAQQMALQEAMLAQQARLAEIEQQAAAAAQLQPVPDIMMPSVLPVPMAPPPITTVTPPVIIAPEDAEPAVVAPAPVSTVAPPTVSPLTTLLAPPAKPTAAQKMAAIKRRQAIAGARGWAKARARAEARLRARARAQAKARARARRRARRRATPVARRRVMASRRPVVGRRVMPRRRPIRRRRPVVRRRPAIRRPVRRRRPMARPRPSAWNRPTAWNRFRAQAVRPRRAVARRRGLRGLLGFGTEADTGAANGNGNGGTPSWMLPVGVGLVLGGLYAMYTSKQKAGGSIFENMGEPTCNGCE